MQKKQETNNLYESFGISLMGSTEKRYKTARKAELSDEVDVFYSGLISQLSASGKNTLDEFYKVMADASMHTPTGTFIDFLTNGGLYNGFTTIGGMPNVGKTTLLVQIGVEASFMGQPVVYITNDMSKHEILLKVLNYISCNFQCDESFDINDLSARISSGKGIPEELLYALMSICSNFHIRDVGYGADFAFDSFVDNVELEEKYPIGQIVEIYTRAYVKKPIFIIDSLQSVAVDIDKSSKESVDVTLEILKGVQRKYQVPMVLVSNLNRVAYNTHLTLSALKESGNVEYCSSTVLMLEPNYSEYHSFDDFRKSSMRQIIIKSLKDRAGSYQQIHLLYYVEEGRFDVDVLKDNEIKCKPIKRCDTSDTDTTPSKKKSSKRAEDKNSGADVLDIVTNHLVDD